MSIALAQAPDAHAAGLTTIRGTLAELRENRLAWERDVTVLFDDFDSLAVQLALDTAEEDRQAAKSAAEESWRRLAEKNALLARQQETTKLELSTMRGMLEQQTELLTAFIGAATQFGEAAISTGGITKTDPIVNAAQADYAQSHMSSVLES